MRGKGEGSIHHRSDGRWEARLDLGYIGGKRRYKTFYGKTRKEALAKLGREQDNVKQGIKSPPRSYTVAELVATWLNDTASSRSPTTQAVYITNARLHVLPYLERLKLADFSSLHVEQLQNALAEKGLSGRTILKARTVLSGAMAWATRHKLIASNPVPLAGSPRLDSIDKRSLTVSEAKAFVEAVKGHRLEALYLLKLTLGLRTGEVLGLMWSDINFETGQVNIRRQLSRIQEHGGLKLHEPKYSSRRTLYLPSFAVDKLREHQKRQATLRELAAERWQDNGLVFPSIYGTPLEPRNLIRDFHRLRSTLGIPDITVHGLRHSATSLYLALGVPPHVVQAILGHADPGVTLEVYAHAQDEDRLRASKLMHEMLST